MNPQIFGINLAGCGVHCPQRTIRMDQRIYPLRTADTTATK
jgi:hypothetical protein